MSSGIAFITVVNCKYITRARMYVCMSLYEVNVRVFCIVVPCFGYCCVLPQRFSPCFKFSQIVCDKKGCHHVSCNMHTGTHVHATNFTYIIVCFYIHIFISIYICTWLYGHMYIHIYIYSTYACS